MPKFNKKLFRENQEILDYLHNSRLFGHLPEKTLTQIAPLSEMKFHPEGAEILTEGQINNYVYFLVRGTVGVYAAGELIIKLRRIGDIFGEMSVISDKPTSASIIAETPVTVFSVRSKDVGQYTDLNSEEIQNVLYRIFAMILTEKLNLTTHKAKQFEITNRKLEQTLEDLKNTHAQFAQAAKLSSIGELATGIAHELNQPLAYISGNVQLELRSGKDNIDPVSAYETLELVEKGTKRMTKIINHLRNFAHPSSHFRMVHLNELLENSLILLNEQLRVKNIKLDKQYASSLPQISGNEQQLEQVFINLFVNARDALNDTKKPQITMTTEYQDNTSEVIVRISDNGKGISPSDLPKIFDPFFTTKEVGQGTGLGLSVSYGIIKNHSGHIDVASEKGAGTTFSIRIPVPGE